VGAVQLDAVQVPAVQTGLAEEERVDETTAAGIPFTLSNIFICLVTSHQQIAQVHLIVSFFG